MAAVKITIPWENYNGPMFGFEFVGSVAQADDAEDGFEKRKNRMMGTFHNATIEAARQLTRADFTEDPFDEHGFIKPGFGYEHKKFIFDGLVADGMSKEDATTVCWPENLTVEQRASAILRFIELKKGKELTEEEVEPDDEEEAEVGPPPQPEATEPASGSTEIPSEEQPTAPETTPAPRKKRKVG